MKKTSNALSEIDDLDYIDADFLAEEAGGEYVASTMFDSIFIPSKRMPDEMAREMSENVEKLEKQILAEIPLFQTTIEQPYWAKGQNKREFDRVNCDIYGAICLADDRHLLDCIVAHGGLINRADRYTLRQAAELCNLEPIWDVFPDQSVIDRPLLNRGVYFVIDFTTLCQAMGIKNTKANRKVIVSRLNRLSIMQLFLTFSKDGKLIENRSTKVRLVDKDFHCLLDPTGIRNKNSIKEDTITHLIVNISMFYVKSLTDEGQISRKRFLNDYRYLNGNNSIVDFCKFVDSHTREYVHNKFLSELVINYYDRKMSMFGMNQSHKITTTIAMIVDMQRELERHFSLILKREDNPRSRVKCQDYKVLHIPLLGS